MLRLALSIAFVIAVIAIVSPKLETLALSSPGRDEQISAVQSSNYKSLTLEADRNGHFRVEAVINGRRVPMLADTGATSVVLNAEDARKIGLRPHDEDFTVRMNTANGVSRAAPVVLKDIRIGSIRVKNIQALVAEPGVLDINLLGMTFIGALNRFDMKGDTLTLVQ
ncbi:MAG: TIGR02281 family clan AA aspartic protease [Rhodobiaceae bacterium]|nr:TIGR02281 family clan AA aspartic protease [Rhodobiaceae bacterium]MCC0012782.1 TIGR02281 family clan AA aspartic protease [Rhodobiaceae bacterium]MCC0018333.1 TIGR02281 family clan AA aspartic protease [Rhodobiaceae bacterium]MCC0051126.1 TIGR02281 family clan AA aspartic protease [Rhodobiaceae bacterium]MCC0060191.1 TIGR02281 family clan AA aspartic protease [Rhodobiaceae bacterium]